MREVDMRVREKYEGPAILSHGFRVFFLMAGISGFILVPVWLYLFFHGGSLLSDIAALDWHIHEMVFGYLAAVLAGFLLTAIPNWTGQLPIAGRSLLLLSLLWLFGRFVMLAPVPEMVRVVGDSLFLAAMTLVAFREVMFGKNWRNLPVCILVGLLAITNIFFHAEQMGLFTPGTAVRAAVSVISVLIALIGGRIVPSFTTNWLIKIQTESRPVPFGKFDKAVIVLTGLAFASWVLKPEAFYSGWFLLVAGALQFVRLLRWKGWVPWRNALVLVLHVAYLWLPIGLLLLGVGLVWPDVVSTGSAGIHALTAGLMGMMTVAVMTRATLGHTGRELAAGSVGCLVYILLFMAVFSRVFASIVADFYTNGIMLSAVLWCLAFLIFTIHFGAMMLKPRVAPKRPLKISSD